MQALTFATPSKRLFSVGIYALACSLFIAPQVAFSADQLALDTRIWAFAPGDTSSWEQRIQTLSRRGALRLTRMQADHDLPGRRTLRFEQRFHDVPVFGAQIVEHVDERGNALSIAGRLAVEDGFETLPALTPEQALRVVERNAADNRISTEPELVLLPLGGRLVLAYTFLSRSTSSYSLARHFVDARSGDVVLSYEELRTAAAVGVGTGVWSDTKKLSASRDGSQYVADDVLRPARITTYDMRFDQFAFMRGISSGFIATDVDNRWNDGAVVDAHVYAGWTYDYYYARHGRRGVDDANLAIRSFVHFDAGYANAFWDFERQTMNYGDGGFEGGIFFRSFASALDVVAHELSHGVTDATWSGIYYGESGALSETFSDVMGTAVEFFFEEVGDGRNRADYWMGEDLSDPFDPPRASVRNLANPQLLSYPDHFGSRYQGSVDNGGVHINAGIGGNAFYLLIEGGRNRTSGMSIRGLGATNRERAEKIFYRGFTSYLFPAATFSDARKATVRAAEDLYGPGSAEANETSSAWTAVGVE